MLVVGVARPFCVKTKLAFLLTAIIQEIIMAQMRKFEQEAIAKEILDTIKVSDSKEQQALEKSSKELKDIRKLNAKMNSIKEQESKLYKQKRNLQDEIGQAVKDFNDLLPTSKYSLGTSYEDKTTWHTHDWEVRQDIERKLAIALLSNDWQERLPEIISSIASQFTGK